MIKSIYQAWKFSEKKITGDEKDSDFFLSNGSVIQHGIALDVTSKVNNNQACVLRQSLPGIKVDLSKKRIYEVTIQLRKRFGECTVGSLVMCSFISVLNSPRASQVYLSERFLLLTSIAETTIKIADLLGISKPNSSRQIPEYWEEDEVSFLKFIWKFKVTNQLILRCRNCETLFDLIFLKELPPQDTIQFLNLKNKALQNRF